jgi:hypothetical protein
MQLSKPAFLAVREEQHRPAYERKTESGDWISVRKKESTQQDKIV